MCSARFQWLSRHGRVGMSHLCRLLCDVAAQWLFLGRQMAIHRRSSAKGVHRFPEMSSTLWSTNFNKHNGKIHHPMTIYNRLLFIQRPSVGLEVPSLGLEPQPQALAKRGTSYDHGDDPRQRSHLVPAKTLPYSNAAMENRENHSLCVYFSIVKTSILPSGNQTWPWKRDHESFSSDFPIQTSIDMGFSSPCD